ncbi:MAG: DoxX family protein [Anaerolineae bacterium]
MNIVLWVTQILLAAMFLMAGFFKAFQPLDALGQMIPWTLDAPLALVRFIGVSELLAGIGLIAPPLTGIKPRLTIAAAAGIMLVMVSASIFHLARGEYSYIIFNLVLLALAAFVAYGRWKVAPFKKRENLINQPLTNE